MRHHRLFLLALPLAAAAGCTSSSDDAPAADSAAVSTDRSTDTAGGAVAPDSAPDSTAGISRDSAAGDFVRDSVRASFGQSWVSLAPGARRGDFSLRSDGTLSWGDKSLVPAMPLRDTDGSNAALEWSISPTSPNGRWAIAQGEGPTFGHLYIVDRERGTVRPTAATKYGIVHWVQWAPVLPYAVVSNHMEGTALLYRVDLESGEARQIDFGLAVRPPLSATPLEQTFVWLGADRATFQIDARVGCNDAVERCAGVPAAETRRFHVALPTLRVTEVKGG